MGEIRNMATKLIRQTNKLKNRNKLINKMIFTKTDYLSSQTDTNELMN